MSTNTTIFARISTTSTTGYELLVRDKDGNESILPIESTYKNEPFTLVLPENPTGRKYLNSKKVDAANGELELKAVERNASGEHPVSRKSLLEYMSAEDKLLYDQIMERAKKAREEATKKVPLTDIQKAELRVKRAMEALKAIQKAQA